MLEQACQQLTDHGLCTPHYFEIRSNLGATPVHARNNFCMSDLGATCLTGARKGAK
ncbi:MAG: hypothetical protein JWR21_842 [Herminiimonas sp.]|nr:hypothetical protein [Herminiimonas sp.]MDB5852410.1 hypothetical protein [Herminiimonas sp.]